MYYETSRSKIKTIIRNIILKIFGKKSHLLFTFKREFLNLLKNLINKIFFSIDFISDKNKKNKKNIDLINKLNFNKEKIESILSKNEKKFFDKHLKWHHHLFANFSSDDQLKILEIGTYQGETTRFLANIFPNSKITTIDLPDKKFMEINQSDSFKVPLGAQLLSDNLNSIDFTNLKELSNIFIETRKKNLEKDNINFIQIDSFQAIKIFQKNSFDFIWVDGNHIMPQVAFDIFQAFHLCKKNGYILCDDIVMKSHQRATSSNDGYKIIDELTKNNYIKTNYFYQTIQPKKIIELDNFISLSKKLI
jgi:predicted O-methyltransferase YrrM